MKKVIWKSVNLPTPEEICRLVEKRILSREEAREILLTIEDK